MIMALFIIGGIVAGIVASFLGLGEEDSKDLDEE